MKATEDLIHEHNAVLVALTILEKVAAAIAAKSEQGLNGMVIGGKALALTALDLLDEPDLLKQARSEFEGS